MDIGADSPIQHDSFDIIRLVRAQGIKSVIVCQAIKIYMDISDSLDQYADFARVEL